MTTEQIQKLTGKKVKVYFKEHDPRTPIIGRFVELEDSIEYLKKNMVRFVSLSKEDDFQLATDFGKFAFTRLYKVTDFSSIKEVNEPVNG